MGCRFNRREFRSLENALHAVKCQTGLARIQKRCFQRHGGGQIDFRRLWLCPEASSPIYLWTWRLQSISNRCTPTVWKPASLLQFSRGAKVNRIVSSQSMPRRPEAWWCDYIIKNRLPIADDIRSFDVEGYTYNRKLSSETECVFPRNI